MKKSIVYAVITVLIWSTLATSAKLVLDAIPNFEMLFLSSVFAFLFLLVLNTAKGTLRLIKKYEPKELLMMAGLGFLGLFLYSALYYFGISVLGSQEACILNYLWPMMIVIFACIILRERFTVKKIAAMALSFSGIVVLMLGGESAGNSVRIKGIFACVAAAVCYGLFSVLNKKHSLDQNVTMMVIWLTTAVCSLIAGQLTETFVPVKGIQWLGLLWLGVVVNGAAYLLWAKALKMAEDSAVVANLAYLVPFLSVILSAAVLKERLSVSAIAAMALIIGGIVLQSVDIKKKNGNSEVLPWRKKEDAAS